MRIWPSAPLIRSEAQISGQKAILTDFYAKNDPKISFSHFFKKVIKILCASRNPTSPSRTSSCTKAAQDGAKLAPNWVQKSTKNGVPHRTWGPKMGYPIGTWGPKIRNKSVKKSDTTKKRAAPYRAPPYASKKWPTWLQVGLPSRSKIEKKSMQKPIVFLMSLGFDL